MKTVAVYMRVSTQHQEEEQTIKNQEMEIRERIKADGHIWLDENVYRDDGWSGSILERPGLDQLRADAYDGRFEVLYFYDRGRISRKYIHQEIVLEDLRKLNVECIGLHDINGVSDEQRLISGVMGIFHEYERLKITERMRVGKLRKVRESKQLLGYQPKYGYVYHPKVKNVKNGYFTINTKQAEVVKMIFGWYAVGKSKYWVREELHRLNIMPAKAKSDVWSLSVIDRMVRDSTYMGDHYYNKSESVVSKNPHKDKKYRKTIKGSRVVRPKSDWYMTKVPAIVTPELFNEVQKQLVRKPKNNKRNNKKNTYLLAGLIECPCGYSRSGDPSNKCTYYRCNDRLNNVKGTRKCDSPGINSVVLDSIVWDNIEKLLLQPELILDQAIKWQASNSPIQNQLDALEGQLFKIATTEERLAKVYGDGTMTERIYKANIAELNEKRINITNEMSVLRNALDNKPSIPLEKLVDGVVKLVQELDFNNKKQIIQRVVSKVVATKENITLWGFIPLLTSEKVGYEPEYWNRRLAKCRQVNTV